MSNREKESNGTRATPTRSSHDFHVAGTAVRCCCRTEGVTKPRQLRCPREQECGSRPARRGAPARRQRDTGVAVEEGVGGAGNRRHDGEGLFAEVLTKLLVDGEYFDEYLRPPQPPKTLGICATWWWAAEPDYPPSTCCVRVVRLG